MNHIFLKIEGDIEKVSQRVFNALGLGNVMEGDSVHVAGGFYYSFYGFGITIKLEMNSYDYEDDYNYMIAVKKDLVTKLTVADNVVNDITNGVVRLLLDNLRHVQIALEKNDELVILSSE